MEVKKQWLQSAGMYLGIYTLLIVFETLAYFMISAYTVLDSSYSAALRHDFTGLIIALFNIIIIYILSYYGNGSRYLKFSIFMAIAYKFGAASEDWKTIVSLLTEQGVFIFNGVALAILLGLHASWAYMIYWGCKLSIHNDHIYWSEKSLN